ncbi:MAG TPA: phosphoribosyltransferase family protein [Candidatus Humimicrobiaceae bacterium]|nr:phosphoribosyltransferase family protein [Candidatus Humimicrobiaceae bacterium]
MSKKWTSIERTVADGIFHIGAVKFGAFKLKLHEKNPEAPLSPIYLTLRVPENKGPLSSENVEMIGQVLYDLVQRKKILFDVVAGIPRAGEPFAKMIARLSGRPLIKLGKKEEGGARKIDSVVSGGYQSGQLVLLVDDLITQADTKKEAIAVCEEAGLTVAAIVVLVDREQGGSEELRKAGYSLYAVFPLFELLDYYVEAKLLAPEKRDEVKEYVAINR